MADAQPIEPKYATDDSFNPDFLRVSVAIPDLETHRVIAFKGWKPSMSKAADNANVNTEYFERAFRATVTGLAKGSLRGKTFVLNIRQLPKPITPEESYHEVKDGRVLVFLKKQSRGSWYPELEEGLDIYDEEEEKKKIKKAQKADANKEDGKVEADDNSNTPPSP